MNENLLRDDSTCYDWHINGCGVSCHSNFYWLSFIGKAREEMKILFIESDLKILLLPYITFSIFKQIISKNVDIIRLHVAPLRKFLIWFLEK